MARLEDIYDLLSIWSPHKKISYAINGIIMGLGAPLGWLMLKLFFFRPPNLSISSFFVQEITHSPQQILLFLYMTLGTSLVMSITGYLVGRGFDWNEEKTIQIQKAHADIEEQKETFEHRFHRLHTDMSNLYQIGAGIQRSLSTDHVLHLIADGAHRVLNFDRINIFLLDKDKSALVCHDARGHQESNWKDLTIPLSAPAGALVKTIKENEVYLVQDISKMPQDFRLGSPFDEMPELRSRSFACIPLRERGIPLGLIAVDNKHRRSSIRDEKLSSLQILADQGSVALTNISLFQGINELHNELERNFEELLKSKEQFSQIVRELSRGAGSISTSIQQVAGNTDGLSEAVNNTSSSVNQMSISLNEISTSVNNLFEEAEKTVSSSKELSISIQEVEAHAKKSNTLSDQVKKEAEEGSALVQESIHGIGKIQDTVLEAVQVMNQFAQKTEQIGEVLEVINNINEKTHVLALNAAIISSQAGEHGRGFSVVSNEIRALSEQTGASSKEIEKMIDSVQKEVRQAVAIIQSIPNQIETGVHLSRQSGGALNQILKSAGASLDMTQQIEHATREQVKSTEIVLQAFDEVSEMIQKMSRSVEEQNKGSRYIARANENMKKLTEEVANAAGHQSSSFQNVVQMITQVSEMVDSLFREAEKRKLESESIILGIDAIEKKRSSA